MKTSREGAASVRRGGPRAPGRPGAVGGQRGNERTAEAAERREVPRGVFTLLDAHTHSEGKGTLRGARLREGRPGRTCPCGSPNPTHEMPAPRWPPRLPRAPPPPGHPETPPTGAPWAPGPASASPSPDPGAGRPLGRRKGLCCSPGGGPRLCPSVPTGAEPSGPRQWRAGSTLHSGQPGSAHTADPSREQGRDFCRGPAPK